MLKRTVTIFFVACLVALGARAVAQSPSAAQPAAPTPKPAVPLVPAVFTYAGTIEAQGQSANISMTTEIKEDPAGWAIVETTKTPAGDAVDRGIVEKGSLVLRKRTVTQGPITISYDIAPGGKMTGTATTAGGKVQPLSLDAGGDVFADDPGGVQVMATLSLADGYKTTFRNIDIMAMKVNILQLAVAGSERVTVPAGTFDAWKVNVTSDEGSSFTVWIDKTTRKVARINAILAGMNAAKFTAELLK